MKQDWIKISEKLPPLNILVYVKNQGLKKQEASLSYDDLHKYTWQVENKDDYTLLNYFEFWKPIIN